MDGNFCMDSPLVRIILATLGGYLLILLFISVYDWILEEYPRRPTEPLKQELIEHRFHHNEAIKAIGLFSLLPEHEKAALKEWLQSNTISIRQWFSRIDKSNFQIMCMGELHKESTRTFLSKEIFSNVNLDVLLVEATPKELKRLTKKFKAGREYYPLLDADMMNIFRAVETRNPDVKMYGIEETERQAENYRDCPNPRDHSIAQNFWGAFKPGLRHIILFGALHCSNESNWLFHNLQSQASPELKDGMINVRVLGEHQNGPVESFVYFMDEIGIPKGHFAIPDTHSLPKHIYDWFPVLDRQTLKRYRALIVFRT